MITYRLGGQSDNHIIANLHASSWKKHYRGALDSDYLDHRVDQDRLDVWTERCSTSNPDQYILLAQNVEEPIGFVCTYFNHDPEWGSLIDNLHVLDQFNGQGIGKELMRRSAQWVQERLPASSLYLWVLKSNISAITFYKRLGGICVEELYGDIPGGGKADILRFAWSDPTLLL